MQRESEHDMKTSYNGYGNYETWVVNMWLNANPDSQDMLQHIIQAFETVSEQAEELEHVMMTDDNYLPGESSMWADLLHAAVGRVNWREIVEINAA
jgi:hypothetical protein